MVDLVLVMIFCLYGIYDYLSRLAHFATLKILHVIVKLSVKIAASFLKSGFKDFPATYKMTETGSHF